jgi:hypothetical protein
LAAVTVVGLADFAMVTDGFCSAATVVVEVSVTTAPDGAVPLAVPVFVIDPLSTSCWVVEYVAVQVSGAPAARLVSGQLIGDRFGIGSVTPTLVSGTLPLFCTR